MIHLIVYWYERTADKSPDYNKLHTVVIEGETAKECDNKFRQLRETTELNKYTIPQIAGLF